MNKPNELHPSFRFNGQALDRSMLRDTASELIHSADSFKTETGEFLETWLDARNSVEILSSGSTGKPKKIRVLKQHMVNSARATGTFFHLGPGTTALHCLPSRYIAGKMMLVRAMVLGWEIDWVAPGSNPLEGIQRHYDFCAMVPLQFQSSIPYLHHIGTLIVGGAPLTSPGLKLAPALKTCIYETYGMSETLTHIAVKKIHGEGGFKGHSARGSEGGFNTLPGIRVETDPRGCLVIYAPHLGVDGLVTNDLVRLHSPSSFEWVGRADHTINSGGVKLQPEILEQKLAGIIGLPYFVSSRPDKVYGSLPVLLVEGKVDAEALLKKIEERGILGKFESPSAVWSLPAFVYTKTGKIKRAETLETGLALYDSKKNKPWR